MVKLHLEIMAQKRFGLLGLCTFSPPFLPPSSLPPFFPSLIHSFLSALVSDFDDDTKGTFNLPLDNVQQDL